MGDNTFMTRLPTFFLIPWALLTLLPAHASEVYKWVDKQGHTHFSDQRPPNQAVEKLDINPSDISVMKSPTSRPGQTVGKPSPASTPPAYTGIKILSPGNDQAIRANNGSVKVQCQVLPRLDITHHHKLRFIIDGKPLGAIGTTCNLTLNALDRGTHTVAVEIIDKSGKTLLRSATHSFHVKRVSAL